MHKTFYPQGTCSRQIDIELSDDGIIRQVNFTGGCAGNTQGVARLVEGMPAERAIELLHGIDCKGKGTSCPDQLSLALTEALAQGKN
ncbi:MAG: TIGR03905 family TSCPD domain-containing protein [Tidjanibacter sp.]|nr:TIGR03905 family TSCPD domain-containing protein [Tidjanibacter sp.]